MTLSWGVWGSHQTHFHYTANAERNLDLNSLKGWYDFEYDWTRNSPRALPNMFMKLNDYRWIVWIIFLPNMVNISVNLMFCSIYCIFSILRQMKKDNTISAQITLIVNHLTYVNKDWIITWINGLTLCIFCLWSWLSVYFLCLWKRQVHVQKRSIFSGTIRDVCSVAVTWESSSSSFFC